MPVEFIAIYKDNFALIQKDNLSFKVFLEDVKTIPKEEFYKYSTDFVLLFVAEEKVKTKEKFNFKFAVYATLVSVFIYYLIF